MVYEYRYMEGRKVKHQFLPNATQAWCGTGYMWYLGVKWKDDKKTLDTLPLCSLCIRRKK